MIFRFLTWMTCLIGTQIWWCMNGYPTWILCWRIWVPQSLVFSPWCIVIVFVHHFMWLWFMLSSSKSSIMFKNNVLKQQPKSMMNLINNFLPNMWWMLKHGLPTLLVKIFVLGDLPYSYSYLEKVLLSTQKVWIQSNMDSNIVLDMNILDT